MKYLAIALAASALAYGDEAAPPADTVDNSTLAPPKATPFRLYFGPDVFHMQSHFNVPEQTLDKGSRTCDFPKMKLKLDGTYVLFGVGYDFLQPSMVYGGADVFYGWGGCRNPMRIEVTPKPKHRQVHNNLTFLHLEGRVGYTGCPVKSLFLSPFVAVGNYAWHLKNNACYSLKKSWIYGALGIKTRYRFESNFDLGLNAKAMRSVHTYWHTSLNGLSKENRKNSWGYEIAPVFAYHFGPNGMWAAGGEPYFTKLDATTNMNIFGGRLTLDCWF